MPYSFPIGFAESGCVLVPVRTALLPYVAGALRQLEAREFWESEADYQAAYNAVAEIEASMLNSCMTDLIDELRAARGVRPEFASVDPTLRTADMFYSLADLLQSQLDARGVLSSGWFGADPQYATSADVVRAMQGSDKTEGSGILDNVKGLLSSGTQAEDIATNIASLLGNEVGTIVQGGLLTTLIALNAANLALQTAQARNQAVNTDQFTKIIHALRGVVEPGDSILAALRGGDEANSTRNVVDLLK